MDFQVGDMVTWMNDFIMTRRGRIVAVVPAGEAPVIPSGYQEVLGGVTGKAVRDHESYIVAIRSDMVTWPKAHQLHKVDEAKELAEALSKYVNGIGNKVEDVVRHLARDHRTLQQGITKFCVAWLEECDRKHKAVDYDLRNEASAELGMKFVARTTSQERAMPFV